MQNSLLSRVGSWSVRPETRTRIGIRVIIVMSVFLLGSLPIWGKDGDTHDFAQSLSQLLNNNASISSINIPQQTYPVKEVKVTWSYNKSINSAVDMTVNVAGTSWGTTAVGGKATNTTTSFSGTAAKGAITISFANQCGNGTDKGTFKVTKVQLVEGASLYTITASAYPSTAGTVSVSDNIITATPNAGYRVQSGADGYTVLSGSATVTNNGDNTLTVDPSTDCAIQVNFEAIPSHTVTWSVNGAKSSEQVMEGTAISFTTPTTDIPAGKKFAGWGTSEIIIPQSKAPTYVTSATMGTEDLTYYAVMVEETTGTPKAYTLTLNKNHFPESYDAEEVSFSVDAIADDESGDKMSVVMIRKNVVVNSNQLQFKKTNNSTVVAYIYNTTDLSNISSISCGNELTQRIGSTAHPTEEVANKGYFTIENATKNAKSVSSIVVKFVGAPKTYTYMTSCQEMYTITRNAEHGSVVTKIDDTEVNKAAAGTTITLSYTADEEYEWVGYSVVDATSQPVTLTDNTFVMPASAVTVTALFQVKTYPVTFAQGITNGSPSADKTTAAKGETITLTPNPDTNYQLDTWTVTDDNDNPLTVTNNTFIMPASLVNVMATYKSIYEHTITYLANNTLATGEMDPQDFVYNTPVTLSENNFSLAGATFLGWALTTDGEKVYDDKATVTDFSDEDQTLYAVWDKIEYTLTIHDRGQEMSNTVYYGDAYTCPTRTACYGYDFIGWTTNAPSQDGTWDEKPSLINSITITQNTHLYAVYGQKEGEPTPTNTYKKINTINKLESGAKYVIAHKPGSAWMMTDDYDGMNKELSTIEGTEISSFVSPKAGGEVATTNVWTIEGDATNGYSIRSQTGYYVGVHKGGTTMSYFDDEAFTFQITFQDGKASIASGENYLVGASQSGTHYFTIGKEDDNKQIYLYKQVFTTGYNYLSVPECRTLDHITITGDYRTVYKSGDSFDPTSMVVTAYYTEGDPIVLEGDDYELEVNAPLTMDDKQFTVTYTEDGITKQAVGNITMVELKSISVSDAKTQYVEGEKFSTDGMTVTAHYNTTSEPYLTEDYTEEVTGYTLSNTNPLTLADQQIKVLYQGKEATIDITVSERTAYTVTFSVDQNGTPMTYVVSETAKQAGVKVPQVQSCDDYIFVGWSTEELVLEEEYTPVTVTGGRYYPDEDITLYAVFSTIDGGETFLRAKSLDDLVAGKKIILSNVSASKVLTSSLGVANTPTETNGSITSPGSYAEWTLGKNGTQWTLTNNGGKTLGQESLQTTGAQNLALTTKNNLWDIHCLGSDADKRFELGQANSGNTGTVYVEYYSNVWKSYKTTSGTNACSHRIYVQGGTLAYTTLLDCSASMDIYSVLLDGGSGTVTEDAYDVLAGEGITLPAPQLDACMSGWTFYGWCTETVAVTTATQPAKVSSPFVPTADVILYAVYTKNGKYHSNPSCLETPVITPASGNYSAAQTLSITAGEDVLAIYFTTDGTSPVDANGDKATNAIEYTSSLPLTEDVTIKAVAAYLDGNSDEVEATITFTLPASPVFDLTEGTYFVGQTLQITSEAGTTLYYTLNDGQTVDAGSNTATYVFSGVGTYTFEAYATQSGLTSDSITKTYTLTAVPYKATLHIGEETEELFETSSGAGIDLPTTADSPCADGDSWVFAGWAETAVDAETTSAPTFVSGHQSLTSDKDFYAVYVKKTGVTTLLEEDFSQLTLGTTVKSWSGDQQVSNVQNLYEDAARIKMGTKNSYGSLETMALPVAKDGMFAVLFDYAAYSTSKAASLTISDSTRSETIAISASQTKTQAVYQWTAAADYPVLTLATAGNNDKRAYLYGLTIEIGTSTMVYHGQPTCCVHTITFSNEEGESIEPVTIPCLTGKNIVLPTAEKTDCEFSHWTCGTETYYAGEVYSYGADRTDDVTFEAHFSAPISEIVVADTEEKTNEDLPANYSGNITIQQGGILTLNEDISINDFYIETAQGKSGQVKNAEHMTVNGDAYMDYTLSVSGQAAANQWHNFGVPFIVDAREDVFGYRNSQWEKLTYNVDYAIETYHGNRRAKGDYGWDWYQGALQPGVAYSMTVNGDITQFRFRRHKTSATDTWTPEQSPRAPYHKYARSGKGQATDESWNGLANMKLEYVTVSSGNYSKIQVLDANAYEYQTKNTNNVVLTVGAAFFIQTDKEPSQGQGFASVNSVGTKDIYAPQRAGKEIDDERPVADEEIVVTLSSGQTEDYLYLSADNNALPEYEVGKDVAKMFTGAAAKAPQVYTTAYGTRLSAEHAPLENGSREFSLTLVAPQQGAYTLSATIEEATETTEAYLLRNGKIISRILQSSYILNLTKGQHKEYGILLLKRPTPTALNDLSDSHEGAEKILYQGTMYIRCGNQLYDLTGKKIQ